jgi:transcription initiation factor TFIIIB Brf1 subunit/transcription initiation factor TFIIB
MRGFLACMECGSLSLRGIANTEGPVGAGLELNLAKCRDCGWMGMPIEFEAEPEWRAFVAARQGDREPAG